MISCRVRFYHWQSVTHVSFGKWKGRKRYSLEADPWADVSCEVCRNFCKVSTEVSDSSWGFLGFIHFRETRWDTHLPLSGGTCVTQQLQHQLLRTAIAILQLSGLFLPFPTLGPTITRASNSGYYQRHIEQLLFSQTLTPRVILNIMGKTLQKSLTCSTDYILLLLKK